ncbi:MAG: hypothetical protein CL672_03790 [Balneola sp.]|nr:hypothetical protein [Balneola sp.]|tara:strand:- start:2290 stop:2925 length:636 start_codon:yes stop_codon:yes gene_type:complete
MHVKHTDIIRFLMDEMDPCEKISFEQRIQLDQDLLIEVESLKQTWQKTSVYPSFKTPLHLKETIFTEAETSINSSTTNWIWQRMQQDTIKIAASFLVLAIALVAWNTWVPAGQTSSESLTNIEVNEQRIISPLTNAKDISAENNTSKINSEISPWVDHNYIIRFAGTIELNPNQSQGIKHVSQHNSKLRLVNDKTGYTGQSRKILLTGKTP